MAYSHKTQFPRNYIQVVDVNSTPQTVFAAGPPVAISHVVMNNTTGAVQSVIFRAVADTPEIFRIQMANNTSFVVPGWRLDTGGLEVLTLTATAGVRLTVFYVSHTQGA